MCSIRRRGCRLQIARPITRVCRTSISIAFGILRSVKRLMWPRATKAGPRNFWACMPTRSLACFPNWKAILQRTRANSAFLRSCRSATSALLLHLSAIDTSIGRGFHLCRGSTQVRRIPTIWREIFKAFLIRPIVFTKTVTSHNRGESMSTSCASSVCRSSSESSSPS